jgi:hypothetical protein
VKYFPVRKYLGLPHFRIERTFSLVFSTAHLHTRFSNIKSVIVVIYTFTSSTPTGHQNFHMIKFVILHVHDNSLLMVLVESMIRRLPNSLYPTRKNPWQLEAERAYFCNSGIFRIYNNLWERENQVILIQ